MDQEKTPEQSEPEQERPLNRAERRAQQHHKKGAANPGANPSLPDGKGGRSATSGAGPHLLPRTGHK